MNITIPSELREEIDDQYKFVFDALRIALEGDEGQRVMEEIYAERNHLRDRIREIHKEEPETFFSESVTWICKEEET